MALNAAMQGLSRRDDLPARGASDGTYNSDVNAYILPPLIGLPFSDMRQNGEGARHKGDKHYYNLIVVHATLMCLVFLLFVPFAIFRARFKAYKNPRQAIKMHILFNILTIIFATVAFACGNAAVGNRRRYSNPHHIIGLTLYIGILLQAILGMIVHQRGKYKVTPHLPLRTMLHRWLGRAFWLLGLANIPLGLTLYGSPIALFILYALYMFLLLLAYFTYEFYRNRHHSSATVTTEGSQYEYGSEKHDGEGHGGFLKKVAGVGLGILAVKKVSGMFRRRHDNDVSEIDRSSRHSREHSIDDDTHVSTDVGHRYGHHHHTADPVTPTKAAKVGLLAGLLQSARRREIIDDRKPMALGRRPSSPSQRPIQRRLFGGLFNKRGPPPPDPSLDPSLDDSPKKPRRGLFGLFSRKDQHVPPPETDITTDYPDSDDSDDEDPYRTHRRHHHHSGHGAAAAAALTAGAAAAHHHNRPHRASHRPTMSEDSMSYTDTDTHLSPTRIQSMGPPGGLMPPPLTQGSHNGNSSGVTSSHGTSSHHTSTAHIPPPPPGGPPSSSLPLPPEPHHARPYRNHGSPSRKGGRSGLGVSGAGLSSSGEGHGYSDSESSIGASRRPGRSYRAAEATGSGAVPAKSTVMSDDGGTYTGYLSQDSQGVYRPHAALQVRIKKEDNGRTVTTIKRMPTRERTSIDGSSPNTANFPAASSIASPMASQVAPPSAIGIPLPSAAGGSVTDVGASPRVRRGSAGGLERESTHGGTLHVREERRKSNSSLTRPAVDGAEHWQAVENREAVQEEELRRERDARRERRRRRKTGEGFEGSTIGSAAGSGLGRPTFN